MKLLPIILKAVLRLICKITQIDQSNKKTATGKDYQQPISQGQFHTFLLYAKSRGRLFLLNLDLEDIIL